MANRQPWKKDGLTLQMPRGHWVLQMAEIRFSPLAIEDFVITISHIADDLYYVCSNVLYFDRVLYGRRDFMRILFGEPNDN